jgi:hypothetical protein
MGKEGVGNEAAVERNGPAVTQQLPDKVLSVIEENRLFIDENRLMLEGSAMATAAAR